MIKKVLPLLFLIATTAVFFWQFLLKGLLPIPADTIIGLYHPYRDYYSKNYPNGIPFKNFLITDPVRQQYPWRKFSIDSLKKLQLPTWNPYSFSGTPGIANIQSAAFYPLNILFFIFPFNVSWSILILLEPFLGGLFLYLYLKNLKLDKYSSVLGAITFAFSGFFTTWLEWGTVVHVALWLPLILLSIDKIGSRIKNNRRIFLWGLILVFSSASALLAGHLQIFFYLAMVSIVYAFLRFWQFGKTRKFGAILLFSSLITIAIVSIQIIPALKFILLSARGSDSLMWQSEGWFIPWQHMVQFLVPDFFGNPTTLNYWGVWNYGELTGYVGIAPAILAFYGLFFRRDKKTLFFGSLFFLSLIFSLPTPIAKLPYLLNIPFVSTSQPTRMFFLTDFSLAILASLGLNKLRATKIQKELMVSIGFIAILFVLIFSFIQFGANFGVEISNLAIARRNMILPVFLFIASSALLILFLKSKSKIGSYLLIFIIIITVVDLFRFSWKFNTFSKSEYLFPTTPSIAFLQKNAGNFRIATADPRILPPNFSTVYKIQSVEGYDPLFSLRYAELISAINRGKPDISPPFGFNRIVRLSNFDSKLTDLMGVKYILSLSEMNSPKLRKVFEEGQTKVYENKDVTQRAFFVSHVMFAKDDKDVINQMFSSDFDPKTAIIEEHVQNNISGVGKVKIIKYSENEVVLQTDNKSEGFLVLTDSYYPTWRARIGESLKDLKIHRTDYSFRGVFVPAGRNTVIFYNNLL